MGARSYKLCELAALVGGELEGDGEIEIRGVAGIREAEAGEITFVANPRYEEFLRSTHASAVIAGPGLSPAKPLIRADNPYYAYLQVLNLFAVDAASRYPRGVHALAAVSADARIGERVCIGPFCHIGSGVVIGDDSTLLSGTAVGAESTIGSGCLIYSGVTIREGTILGNRVILHPGVVLGADGFGYARNGAQHHKVPQIGRVVIEDDVEIGANTCVDRATTGETRIGRGTKIDNLVQIAHNVVIGENCVIAAQVGISGSTEIGNGVTMGGQAGLAGHITVGDRATIAGQAGVTKSVPANTVVSGYPAREHGEAKRSIAHIAMLPALFGRIKALERRLLAAGVAKGGVHDQATEDDR